jgi:pilus assembly protein CpaE
MNALNTKIQPTRRKRIALYSADARFKQDVAARLDALAIYDVQVEDAEAFLKGPRADARPSVAIFDVGQGEMLDSERLAEARTAWASVPLIALSGELQAEQMRALVRLNTADWLRKPVDPKELINAVTFHDSGSEANKSRVITFIGANGGAGATTLALSAADYLARKSPQNAAGTCIVDLDFQRANCSGYLNIYNEFDLAGVVSSPDRLDVELMDIIKLTHKRGFTLYSFERPGLPFEPGGAQFVFRLLDLAAYRFDDVVLDLPDIETPWQKTVLSTSDEIFLVFELNVASLRRAKGIYTRIRELRGGAANVTLIANKRKRKLFGNHFSKGELEKIFKMPHIKAVSLDTPLLTDALNRALLPSEVHQSARFNKDVTSIFRERLDGAKR